MDLFNEPKGWRILQAMAQQEKDPERLASIIDQMNCLLDQHERRVANRDASVRVSPARATDNSLRLDTQRSLTISGD